MVHVFAAASELGDGAACSAMAERRCSVAARGGGEGNEKWTDEPVGQADVGSSHGLQRQDGRGAWPTQSGGQRRVSSTRRLFSEIGQAL